MPKLGAVGFFSLVLSISSLGQVASDIYIPSLPYIGSSIGGTANLVQFTVSAYMFGFAFSPLFYGPVSDVIGRKKPLLFGLVLCIIGTMICLVTPNIYGLVIGRFIQGCGTGATISLSRSILRDIFRAENLAKMASYLAIGNIIVVACAPMLGGYLQAYFNWRSNFGFLLLYAVSLLMLLLILFPETNIHLQSSKGNKAELLAGYITLLKSKQFIGFSFCAAFAYAGILAYLTEGPFLLQNLVGLTPVQFGWLSIVNSAFYAFGSFINAKIINKLGINKMITNGFILMLISGIIMLVFGLFGKIKAWVIMIPVTVFMLATGFVFANAFAGALTPFPKIAGIAEALAGCVQTIGGFASSSIMAMLGETNQIPLATVFIVLGCLVAASLKLTYISQNNRL